MDRWFAATPHNNPVLFCRRLWGAPYFNTWSECEDDDGRQMKVMLKGGDAATGREEEKGGRGGNEIDVFFSELT